MRLAFFSAAALITSAVTAATPIDGWYASAFGGYTFIPDNLSITRSGFSWTEVSYNGGYNVGGRIGFQNNPIRYELEGTYLNAEPKKFLINKIPQHRVSGETYAALAMANIYYDFPEMVPAIQPFVGGGIGYAWVEGTFNSKGPLFTSHFNGGDNAFAYQGTVGFTYNFSENYAVNVAYRYIGTQRVDNLGKTLQAHLGSVGVIYRFDEYAYK